jgi:hypothetical protein
MAKASCRRSVGDQPFISRAQANRLLVPVAAAGQL